MRAIFAILPLLASTALWAAEFPIQPLIAPGYQPADGKKTDERGIWMEVAEAEIALQRSPLLVRDPEVTEYVKDLTCRVAASYCNDVRVYVIKNPMFNASMAPNGTMLVHTGLLIRVASSDHLAAVLGHELAHYTQIHSLKRLRAAKSRMTAGALISMGLAVGGIDSGGLPEILALSSVMGFTRKQETDADLLGAYFMSEAGMRAGAGAEVWMMLEEEEERASVKRPKGPVFLSSHPPPESRAARLAAVGATLDNGLRPEVKADDPFMTMLQHAYGDLMDEQAQQRDHGRMQALIDRHETMGIAPTDVAFFRGEAWRIRAGAGDHERAMEEYRKSITAQGPPNPRGFRELGYLEYKHGDKEQAKNYFRQFLALNPNASDREMIEFYLEDGW